MAVAMVRTFVLGVCLVLSAVACSSGDNATPSATVRATTSAAVAGSGSATTVAKNAVCSLITRQEATTAIGGTNITDRAFTEPAPEPVAAGLTALVSGCAYSAQTTGGYVKVTLWEAPGQADKLSQVVHVICSGKDEVSGVGDYACWFNDSHREMQVLKGSNYIDVSSSVAQGGALQQLAVTALSRLH